MTLSYYFVLIDKHSYKKDKRIRNIQGMELNLFGRQIMQSAPE